MTDTEIIRVALRHARRHASSFRRGGLALLHKRCSQALEALDRVETELNTIQPPLFVTDHDLPDKS